MNNKCAPVVFIIWIGLLQYSHQHVDYCNGELFGASCASNEVIIMDSAIYGRMELGSCIESDLGYLGCRSDVLHIFDELCSGKQKCEVPVANSHIDVKGPCLKDLLRYIKASYSCKTVFKAQERECAQPYEAKLTERSMTFLSDLHRNNAHNCIQTDRPWILAANPGQILNISLIDFSATDSPRESRIRSYGSITDLKTKAGVQFDRTQRYKNLMLTQWHETEVVFAALPAGSSNRFALEVQVLGCSDMTPPDGAWMTRDGDVMEVGCLSGKHSWTLRCEHNQWVGAVGQCGSNGVIGVSKHAEVQHSSTTVSTNVIVFGICSLVLLASSIVFLIGVLILRRKRSRLNNEHYIYAPATMHADDVRGVVHPGHFAFQTNTLPASNVITANPTLGYKSLHKPVVQ